MIYQFKLTFGATVETLTINPAGWDETDISFVRNSFYNSVLRSLSVNLRFARKSGGGGALIKTAYDTDGLKTLIEVEIKKRNPQTDAFDAFYNGVLDFNDIITERDYIETKIIDGSKEHKFITRDEINYDLDNEVSSDGVAITAFATSPLEVNLPPIDVYLEAKSAGGLDIVDGFASFLSGSIFYIGPTTMNIIGSRVIIPATTAKIYENTSAATIALKIKYYLDYDIKIDYKYLTGPPNSASFTAVLQIIIKNSGGAALSTTTVFNKSDSQTDISADTSTSWSDLEAGIINYNVPASGYVEMAVIYSYTDNNPTGIDGKFTSDIDVMQLDIIETYDSDVAESPAKMFFPHEIFTRLIQLMTSETTTSKLFYSPEVGRTDSEFTSYGADGDYSLIAFTTGKAIRQFPDTPINISMRTAFKTLKGIAPLGLGYDRGNDRFFIDTIDQFYKNTSMFDLGDVKELKVTPYKEGFFSQIVGGYKNKVRYEEVQGVLAFNVGAEFADIVPVKETLDIQIPVNGDSIGIEFARRSQYEDDGTTDTDYDENIYIISSKRDTPSGFIAIPGSDYTSVDGFTGIDEYYNIDISPKRNLLRWASVLASCLWKDLTSVIQFIKTQTGVNITTQLAAETPVVETDDVNASTLANPLYHPEAYEFLAPINSTIIAALNSDPHRYVTFSFDEVTYYGYLLSVEGSDYKKNSTWKLLKANKGVSFPDVFRPSLIRNAEIDNINTSASTTLIEITAIAGNVLTLNTLPEDYIDTSIDWFAQSDDYNAGEPGYTGDYLTQAKITSFDFENNKISLISATGFNVGENICIYSPWVNYEFVAGQKTAGIISASGAGWRAKYVVSGPTWWDDVNSRYTMAFYGRSNVPTVQVGIATSPDLETWTVGNSDTPIIANGDHANFSTNVYAGGNALDVGGGRVAFVVAGYSGSSGYCHMIQMDKDGTNITISNSLLTGTVWFMCGMTYYNSKYVILVLKSSGGAIETWTVEMWESSTIDSGYSKVCDVFTTEYDGNDSVFLEGHADSFCPFVENGRLYCLITGTQRYTISMTQGNRVGGLMSYDNNGNWNIVNKYAPELIFPMYFYNIPSEDYGWAGGHMGGYLSFIKKDGNVYLFCSFLQTADTYQVAALKLKQ